MLSPFFLSLAFLPLLLPFPYLNFPIPSFTFPTFPFLHIHPDFSTLLLTITFPLGLFLPSAILLPYASSHSVLHLLFLSAHFRFFLSTIVISTFIPFLSLVLHLFPLSFFYLFHIHSCFFQPSHFFCFNFSCSLLFYDLNFAVPSLPRTLFPLSFPHFNFAILFPPRRFSPSPFSLLAFSPQLPFSFLFRTNFSLPPFLLFFPLLLSHFLIPSSPFHASIFSYPSPFSSPRRFSPSLILTPLMPAVFFLRFKDRGRNPKIQFFIAQLKLLV